MFKTEQDARGTKCHRARDIFAYPISGPGIVDGNCVTRECMAWRWAKWIIRPRESGTPTVTPPPGAGWQAYGEVADATEDLLQADQDAGLKLYRQQFRRPVGYCGLAGRPEPVDV
jgi:hypothetical protein